MSEEVPPSFVISNARFFRNLLQTIRVITDEATFKLSPDGLELRMLDQSRVAMVDFKLEKEAFTELNCPQEVKLTVSLDDVLSLLKKAKTSDSLSFALEKDYVALKLMGRYRVTYRLRPLEPSVEEELRRPKVEFNAKATLQVSSLKDALASVSAVGDAATLYASPNEFKISSESKLANVEISFKPGDEALLSLEAKETCKASYNVKYLLDMVKAASAVSDEVTLHFSTNMPIKLDFVLPQPGTLTYYLAPRATE